MLRLVTLRKLIVITFLPCSIDKNDNASVWEDKNSFWKGKYMLKYTMWPQSWSAQAAITKCHRLASLNSRYLILTVLEAGKSKSKVPADSVSGESPTSGLQIVASHMAFPQCFLSSYEGTNPITWVLPSWLHLSLIISQRVHLQISSD